MSRSRAPALLCLVVVAGLLGGCASLRSFLLPVRPAPPPDPARAAAIDAFLDASDRLRAHAAFYDHEVRKNHTKMRLMGVFSVLGAGAAAGVTASAFHPQLPDDVRPALTSTSISLSVLSGVFVLLPHAHQYILKEAGYRRQAEAAHAGLLELAEACGIGRLLADDTPIEAVDACGARAASLVARARTFPAESPCNPPPEADLAKLIERARSAQ